MSCGYFCYNDKYFNETVDQYRSTSSTPDLLSVCRRSAPCAPVEHTHGNVGVTSQWWYLHGMSKSAGHCGRCTAVDAEAPVSPGSYLCRALLAKRKRQEPKKRNWRDRQPHNIPKHTGEL